MSRTSGSTSDCRGFVRGRACRRSRGAKAVLPACGKPWPDRPPPNSRRDERARIATIRLILAIRRLRVARAARVMARIVRHALVGLPSCGRRIAPRASPLRTGAVRAVTRPPPVARPSRAPASARLPADRSARRIRNTPSPGALRERIGGDAARRADLCRRPSSGRPTR